MSCNYESICPCYSNMCGRCNWPSPEFLAKCVPLILREYKNEKKHMKGNEYQELAMRTCSIPYNQKWDMLMHAVLGLNSEAGEVAGIFQKEYQGHEIDPLHLKKELGDCLWMIAEACTALGWGLEDIMRLNIENEKLKARYPDGFDSEYSLHRKAKDI